MAKHHSSPKLKDRRGHLAKKIKNYGKESQLSQTEGQKGHMSKIKKKKTTYTLVILYQLSGYHV